MSDTQQLDCVDELHKEHCWHHPQFDVDAVVNELGFCCRCKARVIAHEHTG